MSRLQTTTDAEWLHNPHAGELLRREFMEPLAMDLSTLADAVQTSSDHLARVVAGELPVDAELDLRLTRYFRMSEGFFLRLQDRYEIVEAKRALNGALDRIIPRAA